MGLILTLILLQGADSPPAPEPISLSFQYVYDASYPDVLDPDNLAYQNLLAGDLLSFGGSHLVYSLNDSAERKSLALISGLALGWLEDIPTWAEHEMGHFYWFSKAGFKDFVFVSPDLSRIYEADTLLDVYRAYWRRSDLLATIAKPLPPEFNTPYFLAGMEAGGVNQIQHSLEIFSDRINSGRASILDFVRWLLRLNEVQHYGGDDLDDYVDQVAKLGIETKVSDIKKIQWLKYLSRSSLSMFRGAFLWLTEDDYLVDPWLPFWPEFATYLTTRGTTLKIREPLRKSLEQGAYFYFEPSIQFSLDTDDKEYGLKLGTGNMPVAVYLAGFINNDGGHWYEYGLKVSPWKWLELGIGRTQGDGFTFERELTGKTLYFLKEKESSWKFSVGVFLEF